MTILQRLKSLARKPAIGEGSLVMFDQSIMSVATFAASVLAARALPKDEYSLFVLAWSLIFAILGIHRALAIVPYTIYSPRLDNANRCAYGGSGLLHTVALAATLLTLAGVYWLISRNGFSSASVDAPRLVVLVTIILIPYLFREFARNVLLANLAFRASIVTNTAASLFTIGGIVLMYVTGRLTLESTFGWLAGPAAIAAFILLIQNRAAFRLYPKRFWSDLRLSLNLGRWIFLNVIAFAAASQLFPWMLLWLSSSDAVAAFGACLAIANLVAPFIRGFNAYVLLRMSHGYRGVNHRQLTHLLRKSVIVAAIPLALWLGVSALFADSLLEFAYQQKYASYGLLLIALVAKTVIEGIATPLTNALQAVEKPGVITIALTLGAVCSVAAGIILIGRLDALGAGIAAVLSSIVTAGWKAYRLSRLLEVSKSKIDPIGKN